MNKKEYKRFIELTGLSNVSFYVVFLSFAPSNKDWQTLYHETSKDTLDVLIQQGYIEYYEDTVNGKIVPRYKLTNVGRTLVVKLGDSCTSDLQEILDHYNYVRRAILASKKDTSLTVIFKDNVGYWLKKGKTVEDFKKVINYLFSHWADQPNMVKFLRPATMFKKTGPQYFPEKLAQAEEWLENSHEKLTIKNQEDYDSYLL